MSAMLSKDKKFVHLHCHSFHSILNGAGSSEDYLKKAKEYGHPAMAITDAGTMSGTYEHYKRCREVGIKPIIGMEAFINDRVGLFASQKDEGQDSRQIILVKNQTGYVNLNKLVYKSVNEGFFVRPRIKTEWLIENKEGLIVTTSCLESKFAQLVLQNKEAEAEERIKLFLQEFGEDFYGEIQLNEEISREGIQIQRQYNDFIIRMAQKYNMRLIITGDVHYVNPEDNALQDTLTAINHHELIGGPSCLKRRHLYYSSAEDLSKFNQKFGFNYDENFLSHCMDNTLLVADKCNFEFEVGVEKYPVYEPTPDVVSYFKTENPSEIIKKLAHAKLMQKLKSYQEVGLFNVTTDFVQKYVDRLNYEISVIESKKMLDYFLVNWEILSDYRKKGYETGPARGCFLPGSRVLMADKTFKKIQDIQVGDFVFDAFGEMQMVLNRFEYDVEEEILELTISEPEIMKIFNTKISCTKEHEFLMMEDLRLISEKPNKNNTHWVAAQDISSLERVVSIIDDKRRSLISKKPVQYKGKVYDLEVENSHSYNIEGIGVHNSAAGSLLSWCLDITKIDPIRFGLYFERFLNPERNCLTNNCNVLLKNGKYKNIVDVQVGDPVQTENGTGILVQKHERELKPGEEIFEIETEDGAIIELTGCHIVPVFRNGDRIEIRVDEIMESDYLFVF